MEISNLTIGRKNRRIFLKKLLLPWVINVLQKKRKEKGKEESQPIKDWRKVEKKNRKEKKRKKKYREVLCTRQCLNNVQNCQKQKEGK